MNSALKFAITISAIIILFDLILLFISGNWDLKTVCILGAGFIVLTLFFWVVYLIGRAIWRTEKKVWRWMNEKEEK